MGSDRNPERDQDRVRDPADLFDKYGYVMFPQQRRIYEQLARRLEGRLVLEAGCGNGIGAALLWPRVEGLTATDKSRRNVDFARGLYPWVDFDVWDFTQPWDNGGGAPFDTVVCVEAVEHVADTRAALDNLVAAAAREVWISTPNGTGKRRPPENPFHVTELTPREMHDLLKTNGSVEWYEILGWEDFRPLSDREAETVDPLVYHVRLR